MFLRCLFSSCVLLFSVLEITAQQTLPSVEKNFNEFQLDTKDSSKFNLIGLFTLEELNKFPLHNQHKDFIDTFSIHQSLLTALKNNANQELLIFGGFWWCGDTREILGKLQFYFRKSLFNSSQLQLVGLDRNKLGVSQLSEMFKVERVPTIILLKHGKEIGRIVEQGKTGDWETELALMMQYEK